MITPHFHRLRALRHRLVLETLPPLAEAQLAFGALIAASLYATITSIGG